MSEAVMSLLVHTPDAFETIEPVLVHLADQTIRAQLEILIITFESASVREDDIPSDIFHSVKLLRVPDGSRIIDVREKAFHEAAAPILTFTEDHAFPEPDWAEALVKAHEGDYAAVGPMMHVANPFNAISYADILLGYGPWLNPLESGETEYIAGHNGSYKRQILLDVFGDDIKAYLDTEILIAQRLRSQGHKLYTESQAHIHHVNFSRFRPWFLHIFNTGRLLGALRTKDWDMFRRLVYALGSPLIPWVRLYRTYPDIIRSEDRRQKLWSIIPTLIIGLHVSAFGEFVGYLTASVGSAPEVLTSTETMRIANLNKDEAEKITFYQRRFSDQS